MRIGVLALQGAYIEHRQVLAALGVDVVEVRLPKDLDALDALIIPGGESTTIGKLAVAYGLIEPLRTFAGSKPMWGTCAGMILMAKDVGVRQPLLGVMDIVVERNAYGRQLESFEAQIRSDVLADGDTAAFPGVFIRSPKLATVGKAARAVAWLPDQTAVAALQDRRLATAFHPELTSDRRFHEFFLSLI
jgi:5'-phosphate synthase pdxT subunit